MCKNVGVAYGKKEVPVVNTAARLGVALEQSVFMIQSQHQKSRVKEAGVKVPKFCRALGLESISSGVQIGTGTFVFGGSLLSNVTPASSWKRSET